MLDLSRPIPVTEDVPPRRPRPTRQPADGAFALRLAGAAFTVACLLLVVIGAAAGDSATRAVGATLFGTLALGSGFVSLFPAITLVTYLFGSVIVSLTSTLLVGFVLAETHFWHPVPVFVVLAVAALIAHGAALARTPDRRVPGGGEMLGRLRPAAASLTATLVGVALVVIACLQHAGSYASYYGSLSRVGPLWYLGVALVVVAIPLALRVASRAVLGFSVFALSLTLALTPALLFEYPTVTSAGRHVGVTQVIRHLGGVELSQGIYHRWPALFAGAGMIWDVGDVTNGLSWARWWPVLINPAATLGVFLLARRMLRGRADVPVHRIWVAAALFTVGNVLGNAYFSPQSTCFVLALAVLALALPGGVHDRPGWRLTALTVVSFAITVTHQLTPYLVLLAIVVLTLFRIVRPWWTALLVGVPAIGWAAINYSVLSQYVNLGVLGDATSNAAPPSHGGHLGYARLTEVAIGLPMVLFIGIGLAAFISAVRRRDRLGWTLFVCAASTVLLFVGNNYGNEALFRAALFALPWLVILVACAPNRGERTFVPRAVGTVAALLAGAAVFAIGTDGLDWYRVIHPASVNAISRFELSAPKNSVLLMTGSGNATPGRMTSRSPDVQYLGRDSLNDFPSSTDYHPSQDVLSMTRDLTTTGTATGYYALTSQEIGAYDDLYGIQRYGAYKRFEAAMRSSGYWKPVYAQGETTLYRLDVPAFRAARRAST